MIIRQARAHGFDTKRGIPPFFTSIVLVCDALQHGRCCHACEERLSQHNHPIHPIHRPSIGFQSHHIDILTGLQHFHAICSLIHPGLSHFHPLDPLQCHCRHVDIAHGGGIRERERERERCGCVDWHMNPTAFDLRHTSNPTCCAISSNAYPSVWRCFYTTFSMRCSPYLHPLRPHDIPSLDPADLPMSHDHALILHRIDRTTSALRQVCTRQPVCCTLFCFVLLLSLSSLRHETTIE